MLGSALGLLLLPPALLQRRGALELAAAASSTPLAASAWCGNSFPPFAYSLPWFEFDSSACSVRIVGDLKPELDKGLRPLVAVPSPGLTYEYLENLEALTVSQRRVGFIGLPLSGDTKALAQSLATAITTLDAKRGVHLLAHGLAAPVALKAAALATPGLVSSIILTSPIGSAQDVEPSIQDALAESQAPLLATIVSKGRICVDATAEASSKVSSQLFAELQRSLRGRESELRPVSQLVAATPPLPLLLALSEAGDVISQAATHDILTAARSRGDGSSLVRDATFASSGPLPFVDAREEYGTAILDFCDEVDGVRSRRVAVAGGDQRVMGRV